MDHFSVITLAPMWITFILSNSATLYLVSTGTAIVAMGRRYLVDTHWHRGLSYFKIGWRWVTFALATGQTLLAFLWLIPGPDPEPVYASKAQAATPTLAFSAIRLIDDACQPALSLNLSVNQPD